MERTSSKYVILTFCITILLWSCNANKNEFTPSFIESDETTHKIPDGQNYTFGYIEVLENRDKPDGNTIKLPVYIFKSRNANPKKDPIIYTVGGPGSSTMSSAQYMNYYKYLDDRDFILFEQRGTQYAKPHLDCPEWSEAVYKSSLPDFDSAKYGDSIFENAAITCRDKLVKRGIDLNQYNTNASAADIVDLKNALNIESYNLLTLSYSTKIAQVLIRDYPKDIRSVVMDSPLPLEVNYDEESITNLMEALDRLLSDCQNNPNCNDVYPDLKNRFLNYLKEKTENPLEVIVKNPKNGNDEIFRLKGEDLITVFTSVASINVPFEINKLLNNDLSSVKAQLGYLFDGPSSGSGMGMRLSVWCAEENPFNSEEVIKQESQKYEELQGLSPEVFSSQICEIWGVKKVSDKENLAIKSDIPVLLINGGYDNETPVKWANSMSANLSKSQHLVFKGWRHGPTTNWSNQCAMEAANMFFNNPEKDVDVECFKAIETPKFKIL